MNHLFEISLILNPKVLKGQRKHSWLTRAIFLPQYDVRPPKCGVDPLTAYSILNINDSKLNIFGITQESQDLSEIGENKSK